MRDVKTLFVAPHPDDICFSLGALASKVTCPKHLLSVFTVSAWSEPSWTGGRDQESVTEAKRSEDMQFASATGFEYHAAGLPDPSVRRVPTGRGAVYDTRYKSGDEGVFQARVERAILRLMDRHEFDVLVGPMGLGAHIDHLIVNAAVRSVLRKRPVFGVYYEDLPYANKLPLWRISLRAFGIDPALKPLIQRTDVPVGRKLRLAETYQSQRADAILAALAAHSARLEESAGGAAAGSEATIVERLWTRGGVSLPRSMFEGPASASFAQAEPEGDEMEARALDVP